MSQAAVPGTLPVPEPQASYKVVARGNRWPAGSPPAPRMTHTSLLGPCNSYLLPGSDRIGRIHDQLLIPGQPVDNLQGVAVVVAHGYRQQGHTAIAHSRN